MLRLRSRVRERLEEHCSIDGRTEARVFVGDEYGGERTEK